MLKFFKLVFFLASFILVAQVSWLIEEHHQLSLAHNKLGISYQKAFLEAEKLEKNFFSFLEQISPFLPINHSSKSLEVGERLENINLLLHEYEKDLKQVLHISQSVPGIQPVRGIVSSPYGARISPFSGVYKLHKGIDISAPFGSPVLASANGKIHRCSFSPDYGNVIDVVHDLEFKTRYAHLQKIFVKVGDFVQKGEILGTVGATGETTGSHLHYEVWLGGYHVNPAPFLNRPALNLKANYEYKKPHSWNSKVLVSPPLQKMKIAFWFFIIMFMILLYLFGNFLKNNFFLNFFVKILTRFSGQK